MEAISPPQRLVDLSMRSQATPNTLTRRTLLRNGAAAAAAAMLGARPWSPASAAASVNHLKRSTYTPLVGQSFAPASVELSLVSVSDVAGAKHAKALAGSEDAFVLTFSGPASSPLESGIQRLRHPRIGEFEMFLSPVGQPGRDRRYEAVVDRSVAA